MPGGHNPDARAAELTREALERALDPLELEALTEEQRPGGRGAWR